MKKIIALLLCFALCFGAVSAFAEDSADNDISPDITADSIVSQPKIIVSSFSVDGGSITKSKNSKIKVVLTNTHKTADVCNMKLTFASNDGAVLPAGTDSVYVEKLAHGESYEWNFAVTAASSAETGKHSVNISAEYESVSGEAYASQGNITLSVYNPPEEQPVEDIEIRTQPKLMITDYSVDNEYVVPDSSTVIRVTIVNTNKEYLVRNVKMSFSDDTGDIVTDGMSSKYVDRISSGGTYIWEIPVTAAKTSTIGEHNTMISIDYEDTAGGSYNVSEVLRIPVRQTSQLDFDGASLPTKVVQGDTVTVSVNLMNTGKSALYNCKMQCDIESLLSGGTSFAGQIDPGTNKTVAANLQVSTEAEGEVKGTIIISYEDAFGEVTEQKVNVSTIIDKKIEVAEKEEEEEKKMNPLWWLFILIGLLVGGGAGFGIPFALRERKQRLEDEQKL